MYRLDKAGNFIEFKNGKSIKPGGEGAYPVYGANGIIGMSDEHRELNSVIIGRVGAYCGAVQYCKGRYWASDNTIVAYPKDENTNVLFLYYQLRNANLNRWAGGAAQPLMTQTVIEQINLPYPNIDIQRKLVSMLSAYDDLIENNTRRIQILEEMAQRIYREWFVYFRFPGHEKVKFVDSTMGKIHEGAKVVKFGGLIEIKKGKKSIEVFVSPNINTVPYLLIDFFDGMHSSYVNKEKTVLVEDDEVLMVMDGARSGLISLSDHGAIGSTIACLRSKKSSPFYLYHFLKFNEDIIRSKNTGAAIPHANKDFMNLMDIIMFPDRVLDEFVRTVKPIHHLKRKLRYKTKNLRNTRDVLLPKLISGEIDVSEMDITIWEQDTKNEKAIGI